MRLTFDKTGKLIIGLTVLVIIALCAGGCFWGNHAPVISGVQPGQELILSSHSCTIECVASDPDEDSLSYSWSATGGEINGNGSDATWTAPKSGSSSYTITVVVRDEKGAEDEDSVTVEVNNEPHIVSLIVDEEHVAPSSNCNIVCDASDADDGDELSYFWSATGGTISWEDSIATWSAPSDTGSYIIRVEVSDGRGGKAVEYLTINITSVASNNPPEIKDLTVTPEDKIHKHKTATIECHASDPDGDELSYDWWAEKGDISWEGSVATWEAPGQEGTFTIMVTVSDGRGGEDSETIVLRVCT